MMKVNNNMKNIILFITISMSIFSIEKLNAQVDQIHEVNAKFIKPGPTKFGIVGESYMEASTVNVDFLQLEVIPVNMDGEITFETISFNGPTEDFIVRLRNFDNPTDSWNLNVNNSMLTLDVNYQGASTTHSLGPYQIGDKFRIVRCGEDIIYYFNQNMVWGGKLSDNNFRIVGEVSVNNTSSAYYKAYIEFHRL